MQSSESIESSAHPVLTQSEASAPPAPPARAEPQIVPTLESARARMRLKSMHTPPNVTACAQASLETDRSEAQLPVAPSAHPVLPLESGAEGLTVCGDV